MGTGPQQDAGRGGSRRKRLIWIGAGLVAVLAIAIPLALVVPGSDSAAASLKGTARADVLRGTNSRDVIDGRAGNDRLIGLAGPDRLVGGPGDDVLVGGRGTDTLIGSRGDDVFFAKDGARDRIYCGAGFDRVNSSDTNDQLFNCELVDRDLPPATDSIELVDEAWTCRGPVNVKLVKVTIRSAMTDAVYLREDCSGYIGRIEIETWTQDGIKVNAPPPATHDLVVGGGYIRCFDHGPEAHQDGIQVMGGERITFRRLEIECNSQPNAQLFISGINGGVPTNVVCDRCHLGHGAASTLFITLSVSSGARNSTICPGRFNTRRIAPNATDVVDSRNTVLAENHPRCRPS